MGKEPRKQLCECTLDPEHYMVCECRQEEIEALKKQAVERDAKIKLQIVPRLKEDNVALKMRVKELQEKNVALKEKNKYIYRGLTKANKEREGIKKKAFGRKTKLKKQSAALKLAGEALEKIRKENQEEMLNAPGYCDCGSCRICYAESVEEYIRDKQKAITQAQSGAVNGKDGG